MKILLDINENKVDFVMELLRISMLSIYDKSEQSDITGNDLKSWINDL